LWANARCELRPSWGYGGFVADDGRLDETT